MKNCRIGLVLLSLLCLATPAYAQFQYPAPGARNAAMGGSFIALDDFWSAANSLAGAALLHEDHFQFGISHQQHHMLSHFTQQIAAILPIKTGTLIGGLATFGNHDYRESMFTAGYTMKLMPTLAMGISSHVLTTSVSDAYYDNPPARVTISAALQYQTQNVIIGAKVFNPVFVQMGTETESHIPVVMGIGASYQIHESLLATAEFEKNIYLPLTSKLGIEYTYRDCLSARIGFSTNPGIYTFGLGYQGTSYNIDLAAQMHPYLGLTPQISGNIRF